MNFKFLARSVLTFALAAMPLSLVTHDGSIFLGNSEALAGPGNGNGNGNAGGNGNGNGNGNAGGNGNGRGLALGHAKSGAGGNAKGSGINLSKNLEKLGVNRHGKQIGQLRAEFARAYSGLIGNMNALRGSPAFAKAAEGSNIANIAAFAESIQATADQSAEAEALVDVLTNDYNLTPEQIALYADATEAEITDAIDASLIDTDATAADIASALGDLSNAQAELGTLQQEADDAFEAAAKKDISPEARQAIEEQLQMQTQ